MTEQRRNSHSDNAVIGEADDLPTPSQGGSAGGGMQREIGALDDEKVATGADPQPTSVHKGQKPNDGDQPNLPNRQQTGDHDSEAPPRRT